MNPLYLVHTYYGGGSVKPIFEQTHLFYSGVMLSRYCRASMESPVFLQVFSTVSAVQEKMLSYPMCSHAC